MRKLLEFGVATAKKQSPVNFLFFKPTFPSKKIHCSINITKSKQKADFVCETENSFPEILTKGPHTYFEFGLLWNLWTEVTNLLLIQSRNLSHVNRYQCVLVNRHWTPRHQECTIEHLWNDFDDSLSLNKLRKPNEEDFTFIFGKRAKDV